MTSPRRGPHSGMAIRRPRPDQIARFWKRVNKDGKCWLWTGAVNVCSGYGAVSLMDQRLGPIHAHRVSYAIAHGLCPGGLVIMHTCDVKACVNPAHLRAGTQGENTLDARRKGRLGKAKATACRWCGAARDESITYALCIECDRVRRGKDNAAARRNRRAARMVRIPEGLPATFAGFVEAVRDERRATIMARNFGLYHFPSPETLAAIAPDFGLTRERVRQLVVSACHRLNIEPLTFWGKEAA